MKNQIVAILFLAAILFNNTSFAHSTIHFSKKINNVERRIEARLLRGKIQRLEKFQADTIVKLGLLESHLDSGFVAKFYSSNKRVNTVSLVLNAATVLTAAEVVSIISQKFFKANAKSAEYILYLVGVPFGSYLSINFVLDHEYLYESYMELRRDFMKEIKWAKQEKLQEVYDQLQEDLKDCSVRLAELDEELAAITDAE